MTQGEVVLIEVAAVDASSAANFTLQYINLDQFENNGEQVEGTISDSVSVPVPALTAELYAVTAPSDGTPLQVTFSTSGGYAGTVRVRVLNSMQTALVAGSQYVASGGSAFFDLSSVAAGQTVYVQILPGNAPQNPGDEVDYTLTGTQAEGTISDSQTLPAAVLSPQNYAVTASLDGTLQVTFSKWRLCGPASGAGSQLVRRRLFWLAATMSRPAALSNSPFLR